MAHGMRLGLSPPEVTTQAPSLDVQATRVVDDPGGIALVASEPKQATAVGQGHPLLRDFPKFSQLPNPLVDAYLAELECGLQGVVAQGLLGLSQDVGREIIHDLVRGQGQDAEGNLSTAAFDHGVEIDGVASAAAGVTLPQEAGTVSALENRKRGVLVLVAWALEHADLNSPLEVQVAPDELEGGEGLIALGVIHGLGVLLVETAHLLDERHQAVVLNQTDAFLRAAFAEADRVDLAFADELREERAAQTGDVAVLPRLRKPHPLGAVHLGVLVATVVVGGGSD